MTAPLTRRRPAAALAVATLLMLGGVTAAQPTSAAWADGARLRSAASSADVTAWRPWYGQVRLAGTQLCLDVPGRETGTGLAVQIYPCNSTPAQIWAFGTDSSLRVYASVGIRAPGDNPAPRCLEGHRWGGFLWWTTSATIESCPGDMPADREWTLAAATGGVRIQNAELGRCLDVPSSGRTQGAALELELCGANGRAQVWVLEPVLVVSYA